MTTRELLFTLNFVCLKNFANKIFMNDILDNVKNFIFGDFFGGT
jgi:hypothetical protein